MGQLFIEGKEVAMPGLHDPECLAAGATFEGLGWKFKDGRVEGQGRQCDQLRRLDETRVAYRTGSKLCVNEWLVSKECTSFSCFKGHLLFICNTSQMFQNLYLLKGEQITQSEPKLPAPSSGDFRVRRVERGSRIVSCCKDGKVVLSHPRGNFEAVYPKLFTLAGAYALFQEKKFRSCLLYLRKHKLSLGLLVDFDPAFPDAPAILSQLAPQEINLLVTQLSQAPAPQLQYSPAKDKKGHAKSLRTLCMTIVDILRKIDQQKYLLSILTALHKAGQLPTALYLVLRYKAPVVEKIPPHLDTKRGRQSIKQYLEYLTWLAGPKQVFEEALLTYDLELARISAKYTDIDPLDYGQFFARVERMQQVQRRHQICVRLKRWDKAIIALSAGSPQQRQKAISICVKQKLWKVGLTNFDQPLKKTLKIELAEHLRSKGQLNQAMQMYQSAGCVKEAMQVAVGIGDVARVLSYIKALSMKDQQKMQLLKSMQERANTSRLLAEVTQALGDYDRAFINYLKCQKYKKANQNLLLARKDGIRQEGVEVMRTNSELQGNQLKSACNQFTVKYQRLQEVQLNKQKMMQLQGVVELGDAESMSQTSAISRAGQTEYTVSTTTGLRKKKQKKRDILSRNIKEGSPAEEEYLVAWLLRAQEQEQTLVRDTKELIHELIYFDMLAEAAEQKQLLNRLRVVTNKQVMSLQQRKVRQSLGPGAGKAAPGEKDLSCFDYII